MIAYRATLGSLVGLLLGASAVLWGRATAPGAELESELGSVETGPCLQNKVVAREYQQLEQRLSVATELLRGLRATETELVGAPVPWPASLPEDYAPDRVRAAVERAFADTPYQVDWIDCEEFPCIVATQWTEETDEAQPAQPFQHSFKELSDKGVDNRQLMLSAKFLLGGGVTVKEWSALGPAELVEDVPNKRLNHRWRTVEAYREEIGE